MGYLGKTPVRGHRVLTADQHYAAAGAQSGIDLPLPVASGGYAISRIEIQEQRLIALLAQAFCHIVRSTVVKAAVTDEYAGQFGCPVLSLSREKYNPNLDPDQTGGSAA